MAPRIACEHPKHRYAALRRGTRRPGIRPRSLAKGTRHPPDGSRLSRGRSFFDRVAPRNQRYLATERSSTGSRHGGSETRRGANCFACAPRMATHSTRKVPCRNVILRVPSGGQIAVFTLNLVIVFNFGRTPEKLTPADLLTCRATHLKARYVDLVKLDGQVVRRVLVTCRLAAREYPCCNVFAGAAQLQQLGTRLIRGLGNVEICKRNLPALKPVPWMLVGLAAPQLQECSSISPVCFEAALSPVIPSSFKKYSMAIVFSLLVSSIIVLHLLGGLAAKPPKKSPQARPSRAPAKMPPSEGKR